MNFVIDRSKWRCGAGNLGHVYLGNGFGATLLLNDDGFMCCLGQVSEQCGVEKQDLLGKPNPDNVKAKMPRMLVYHGRTTQLARKAIVANDDREISQATREQRLKDIFAEKGHRIKFVGKVVKP